jgi:hypothetical protein
MNLSERPIEDHLGNAEEGLATALNALAGVAYSIGDERAGDALELACRIVCLDCAPDDSLPPDELRAALEALIGGAP